METVKPALRPGIIAEDFRAKIDGVKGKGKRTFGEKDKPKDIEESLMHYAKLKQESLRKQEEIINSSNVSRKKELINNFNISKVKYVSKVSELKKLGELGLKLEEMRVSIEKRYEYMLNDLNTKLESLKKHFNNIINDAKGEAFNSIVNEKDHNLSNIKEYLEEKLLKYIQSENNPNASAADKDAQQNIEGSFHDFFAFFHDFREECFGMIVSKITNLNLENLKNQIQHFKSKYLESILNAPKVFTSQLFRYFEDSLKQNPEQKQHVTKGFGDVLSIKQEFTDSANFSKLGRFYDPELNCKSKTPMISIINKDYLVVVSRDRFRIAGYQYSNSGAKIPKSRFYTNTHNDTGEELTFSDVYCSEASFDDKGEVVSYHSVCAARTQDDNYCILLGGNDCVECRR